MSFSKKENKTGIHTPANVLNKLNSELTDSERKQFLVTLANSKDTVDILITVIQNWERLLFKQQLEIAILEENVRVFTDSLRLSKKYKCVEECPESMMQKIDEYTLSLSSKMIENENGTGWALKTRAIMQEILNPDEKESVGLSLS